MINKKFLKKKMNYIQFDNDFAIKFDQLYDCCKQVILNNGVFFVKNNTFYYIETPLITKLPENFDILNKYGTIIYALPIDHKIYVGVECHNIDTVEEVKIFEQEFDLINTENKILLSIKCDKLNSTYKSGGSAYFFNHCMKHSFTIEQKIDYMYDMINKYLHVTQFANQLLVITSSHDIHINFIKDKLFMDSKQIQKDILSQFHYPHMLYDFFKWNEMEYVVLFFLHDTDLREVEILLKKQLFDRFYNIKLLILNQDILRIICNKYYIGFLE